MANNPHADKAKELLVHYLNNGDPAEVASIVDHILDAVSLEIGRELKAVFGGINEGRKAASQILEESRGAVHLPTNLAKNSLIDRFVPNAPPKPERKDQS